MLRDHAGTSKAREEAIQSAIKRMGSVMRGVIGQGFLFGDFTLSKAQVGILFLVAEKKEGAPVKRLVEMLGVTPGAVTQFVDALVEKGLVSREEDPDDRRILRIRLTALAESNFERFRKDYFRSLGLLFGPLNDGEIKQLAGLLGKIKVPNGR